LIEHFRELHRHRALLECLVRREVRARYRGSVLGYLWTLANPLLLLAVYLLVFERLTKAVQVDRYPLYLFAGILPWLWISGSLAAGTVSILQGSHLVVNACIPPGILPAVVVISNLVNLVLGLPVALAATIAYGVSPLPALAVLPLAVLLLLLFLYGAALAVAALTVALRDFQHLVQNALLVWFFLTPVAWPASVVPAEWGPLLAANPAAALVAPFQRALHEGVVPSPGELALAAAWAVAGLLGGVAVFEALRGRLAEEI